jgi:hypothetical protein
MNSSAVRNFGKYLVGHDGRVRHRAPDGGATASKVWASGFGPLSVCVEVEMQGLGGTPAILMQ